MDCEAFNDLLMDLVYDELDEVRTAAMRKHMESCSECERAHLSLTKGRGFGAKLALTAPPPLSVDVRAALDAPLVSGPVSIAPALEPVAHEGAAPRWLRTLGEFAMRRQVAMAAVFLLMVGFGLRYARQSTMQPSTVIDSTDGPHPAVIPATELHSEAPPAEPPTQALAVPTQAHRAPPSPLHRPVAPPRPAPVANAPQGLATPAPAPTPTAPSALDELPTRNAPSGYVPPRNSLDSVLPQAPNTQGFRGTDTLSAAESQANDFRSRGQHAQEITALQTALAGAQDDAARSRLSLRLITALHNAGRHDEANALQARLTHHEGNLNAIINELPAAPSPGSSNSPSSVNHPSVAHPSVSRPMRQSVDSNLQNQAF